MNGCLWWCLAVALACGCATDEPTQLLVVLSTDMGVPEELDAARIVVRGPDGELAHDEEVALGEPLTEHGSWRVLASFGAVPKDGDGSRSVTVEVSAMRGATTRFTTRAVTGFVRGRRMRLDIFLARGCLELAETCRPEQTCGLEGCVDPVVPADALVPADGVRTDPTDSRSRPDGGPLDAGTMDGGVDAGADAGPPDGGPELCNAVDDDGDGRVDEDEACAPCRPAQLEGAAYLFCLEASTWDEAREACHTRGYELVVLESEAEDRWVWSEIGEEAWIGLTDRVEEGTYVWVDGTLAYRDGVSHTYTNWRNGVPEDIDGQDCIQLDTELSDGQWADDECSDLFSYVCEASPR